MQPCQRDLLPSDLEAVAQLEIPSAWAGLELEFARYLAEPHARARATCIAGELVGVGAVTYFADSAWLGHIVVDGGHQGRGLGTQITRDLLACAQAEGRRRIVLSASDAGRPMYRKMGFAEIAVYHCWQAPERAHAHAQPSGPAAPIRQSSLPVDAAVLALDREATGDERAWLWQHYTRDRPIRLVRGSGSGRELAGFFQAGICDGPVIAADIDAGQALLQFKLRQSPAPSRVVATPDANRHANETLQDAGWHIHHDQYRMELGSSARATNWRPDWIYARAAGYIG